MSFPTSASGFWIVDTPSLAIEMVCAGNLEYEDGYRVWRKCFTNRKKWILFEGRVKQACPDRV